MTCDGYIDGEWYGHQGVQVLAWPALENCVTLDAEACNELRAVFHMLGEQVDLTLGEPLKPWPFPTGKAPEKQPEPPKAPEVTMRFHISAPPMDAATLAQIKASLRSCRLEGRQPQQASATQPSEPQVRSRSAAAKSPLNGLLTEQSGRYCGLGFNGEE
jgi:hypothetical protein